MMEQLSNQFNGYVIGISRRGKKIFARASLNGTACNLPDDRRRAGHCFVRHIAARRQRRPQSGSKSPGFVGLAVKANAANNFVPVRI